MLIALTTYLYFHFSSHVPAVTPPLDQTAALLRKDVVDDVRQKQALAIVDQMKATTKAFATQRVRSLDTLNDLLAKRATPASQIEQCAQPLIAEDKVAAEELLDLRFRWKSVLTASEWAKVFPPPVTEPTGAKKSA